MWRRRALPRVVQSRVDMLSIGFDISMSTLVAGSLTDAKARAARPGAGGIAAYPIGNESFQIRARGAQGHAFVLRNGLAEVLATERDVEVRIHPALLRPHGIQGALDYARSTARLLSTCIHGERVRRVDACADVAFALRDIDVSAFVGRARRALTSERESKLGDLLPTSLTFGRGGPISVRIYDKVEQLRQHASSSTRTAEREAWHSGGARPTDPITRVEIQLRGQALNRFDLRSADRLTARLDGAWDHVLRRWLRLIDPSTSTRRERARLAPLWSSLLRVSFGKTPTSALPLPSPLAAGGASLEGAVGTILSALASSHQLGPVPRGVAPEVHVGSALAAAIRSSVVLRCNLAARIDATLARFALPPVEVEGA